MALVRRPLVAVSLAGLFLAALAGSACRSAGPLPREVPKYTIEAFMAVDSWFGGSFSPDGSKVLVSGDASGVYNLYALPVAGGEPTPLTDATDSTFAVGYFPNDERILFLRDRGGNELSHLYVREVDGTERDLTPGDQVKAGFLGWSANGDRFWATTNERDPRFFDVYAYSTDGYGRELAFRNDVGFGVADVAPDGRHIALVETRGTRDSDVWLVDQASGKSENLTAHEGDVANGVETFSADGSALYLTTDAGSEFSHLVRHDIATGERRTVAAPDWDVMYAAVSRGGKFLVVGVNRDARTEVELYDGATLERSALPAFPAGGDVKSVGFSNDETLVAAWIGTGRTPSDLWVGPVSGGEMRPLTRSLTETIDAEALVEPEVVRFASYDGVEVPGLLYLPHGASPDNRVPALVWVHGGPGGQSRVGYSDLIQYLVNHGYAVYAINNRGSSGYGKTFFGMDDRRHGEADLDDCVASKKMLIDTGKIDPDRIGIIGGSYGGYMVLAALAFRPEEFAAGVDLFGVANWVRTLESVPPYWESFRKALYREMGDPANDAERLRRISPLFHAEDVRRPLMVLQGANDPRVLQVESDEIVAAVRANGVPVEYVVFDDEGHGFLKKDNQARGYRGILEFLDRYLAGTAAAG